MSILPPNHGYIQQPSRLACCLIFGVLVASSPPAIAHVLSQALNCSPQQWIVGDRIESEPILVFLGELSSLPLQSIRDTKSTAFAFPGRTIRINGAQDVAIREAIRAGVHIVLPHGMSSLYQAATGKDLLFMESDKSQNETLATFSMDGTLDRQMSPGQLPLFIVRQPKHNSGAIVFDRSPESATTQGKLAVVEGHESVEAIWSRAHRSIETVLETDQVRCAYNHLNCDFVAGGEVFRKLCQRLRQEYYIREQVDLFKFASRIKPYNGVDDVLDLPGSRVNAGSLTNENFVSSNRLRVDTAYKHLVSRSAVAEAPIKEVMYVLYTVSDTTLLDAQAGKVDLARELSAMGARTPYSDVLYSIPMTLHVRWLSRVLFVLGLACIGYSARVAATVVGQAMRDLNLTRRHVGQASRPLPSSSRGRRAGEQLQAGPGGKRNALVEYLMLRAQRMSKAT
jgi:hypothetical protein